MVTAWSWAGPYLGVNYGYAWGKSDTNTALSDAAMGTPLVAAHTPFKFNDMIFGGQAGFNWQAGAWVAGIEADFQQSRQRGRAATPNCATAIRKPASGAVCRDATATRAMAHK